MTCPGAQGRMPHPLDRDGEPRHFEPSSTSMAGSLRLSDFINMYLDYSRKIHTAKTVGSTKTAFREFSRFLKEDPKIRKIKVVQCEQFLARKTVEASAASARKYHGALSAAFGRAHAWGYLSENIWCRIKKPRVPEVLPAYLSRTQYADLRKRFKNPIYREIADLSLLTGMRIGEAVAMEWDWIDLNRKAITVKNTSTFTTKSKHPRVIPLCDDAVSLLSRLSTRAGKAGELVFQRKGRPLRGDTISHVFKQCVREAGLSDKIHWHSLRHSFASWLVESGASLFQVSKLLGHASTTTTAVYAHLIPDQLHSVVSVISIWQDAAAQQ
jgi:site-specific recombinase XerD